MSKNTTPEMPTFLNSGNSTSLFKMICMLPPSGRLPRPLADVAGLLDAAASGPSERGA